MFSHYKKLRKLWFVLGASLMGFVLGGFVRANATTIIGDSHVGGLRPYLIKHMRVYYKNGSTASYWLKRKITDGALIVMTGTNDRLAGKSSSTWLKQTEAICRQARRCWIVSPPNVQGEYRTALKDKNNVIWSGNYQTRDGVHLYPSGYKALAEKILAKP